MRSFFILLLFVTFGMLSTGCKEGDPLSAGIDPAVAGFEAETPDVTEDYVSLRTNHIDGGTIVLDIVVTEVDEPVFGIEMKLRYPAPFAKFIVCTDGDLLPPGDADDCFSSEPEEGVVLIARNTIGNQTTTVSGDRVIARVEFLVFGDGADEIMIEGQNLGGGATSALLDADLDPIFVKWFSGILEGESVIGN